MLASATTLRSTPTIPLSIQEQPHAQDMIHSVAYLKWYHDHPPKLPAYALRHVELLRRVSITTQQGVYTIQNPLLTVLAAGIVGVPLPVVLGLLTRESFGGKNIWGGDAHNFAGGIDQRFRPPKKWGPTVTEPAYKSYKAQRAVGGEQGVGPAQVTLTELQDYADEIGGTWKIFPNLLVGFDFFAHFFVEHDVYAALNYYNHNTASGDYGTIVLGYADLWAKKLGMGSNRGLWGI
jgi:hypothetical protein